MIATASRKTYGPYPWGFRQPHLGASPRRRHGCLRSPSRNRLYELEQFEPRLLLSTDVSNIPVWGPQGPGPIHSGAQTAGLTSQNGPVAGAITSIAVDPNHSNIIYVGTVNGGIWKTNEGNLGSPHWVPLTDQYLSLSIGSVAISPVDSNTVFAGIADLSSEKSVGGPLTGLLKSTDAGQTWFFVDNYSLSGVNIKTVLPTAIDNGNVVLAAGDKGLYRSTDGGKSFTQISGKGHIFGIGSSGLPEGSVTDLVADPAVAQSQGFYAALPGKGVYHSTDGGQNWSTVNTGLTGSDTSKRIRLAINSGGTLFAAIVDNTGVLTNVFQLAGSNWSALGIAPTVNQGSQGKTHLAMAADPNNPNGVYIGGDTDANATGNVFRWDGSQWIRIVRSDNPATGVVEGANGTAPHADTRCMVFASGHLLEGCDGGIYEYDPLISLWSSLNGDIQPTELYSVAWSPDALGRILGGAQDVGVALQDFPPNPVWNDVNQGGDGSIVQSANVNGTPVYYYSNDHLGAGFGFNRGVDANDDGQITAAELTTLPLTVQNTAGGISLNQAVPGGPPTFDSTIRFVQLFALNSADSLDPTVGLNAKRMVFGSDYLYESRDGGQTVVSLGGLNPTNTGPAGSLGEVTALAYGGKSGGVANLDVLYVGMGGKLFLRQAGNGMPAQVNTYPGSAIRDIVLDPDDWHIAYLLDTKNRVWRTTDAGATAGAWTQLTGNLGDFKILVQGLQTIEVVKKDGKVVVLVGGPGGVFRAIDPGANSTWAEFGQGLPNAIITDLHYNPSQHALLAGTFGRGAWTIPDDKLTTPESVQITNPDDPTLPNLAITLRRNPNNPLILDIFETTIATGATPSPASSSATPTKSVPISTVEKVVVNGLFHDNKVFIDVVNGDIKIPVEFNGTGNNSTQTVNQPSQSLVSRIWNGFVDGLKWIGHGLASLLGFGAASKPLPLVNNSIGTIFNSAGKQLSGPISIRDLPSSSVDDTLSTLDQLPGIEGIFQSVLVQRISDYLDMDLVPTPDKLVALLKDLGGEFDGILLAVDPDSVNFTLNSSQLEFNLNLHLAATAQDLPIDLGTSASGLSLDASATVDATATVDLNFSFGMDLTPGLALEDAFFVQVNDLKVGASVDASNVNLAGKLGFLEVQLGDGTAASKINVGANIDVGFNDPDGDGKITGAELTGTSLSSLVTLTPGGPLNVALPISAALGSGTGAFSATGSLQITDDNIFTDPPPTVSFTAPDALKNFRNLSAAGLLSLLQNLGTTLQSVAKTLDPNGGIPFLQKTISQITDFTNSLTDFSRRFLRVELKAGAAQTGSNALPADGKLVDDAVFQVAVGANDFQTITLPAGNYSNTAGVVAALNTKLSGTGVVASLDNNGHLKVSPTGTGSSVRMQFDADNKGMPELGFPATFSNSVPKFSSVQDFINFLKTFLGLDDAGIALAYDSTNNLLTFHFKEGLNFSQSVAFDFSKDLSLGPLGSLSVAGNAGAIFSVGASLDFTLGIDLSSGGGASLTTGTQLSGLNGGDGVQVNTDVILSAFNIPVGNGQLSGTANFSLQLNNDSPVAVSVAPNSSNTSAADLISDINAALATAGIGSKIGARLYNGRIELFGLDSSVTKLQLTATAGDPAITQLGFGASQTDGDIRITRRDGVVFDVDLSSLTGTSTLQDVINLIANAPGNTGQKVTATINDTQDGLKLVDSSTGTTTFAVQQINHSLAGFSLGILGSSQSTDGSNAIIVGLALNQKPLGDRVFINEGGSLSAAATIATDAHNINLTASLGLLEVGIKDGTGSISINTGVKLVDPGTGAAHDGRVTFNELTSGANVVSDVTLTASGTLTLPLTFTGLDLLTAITPTDPKITLTFSASPITFTSDFTGFPDLSKLTDFSTENLFALLKQALAFIQSSDLKLFNTPLPLLNKSVKDLIAGFNNLTSSLNSFLGGVGQIKTNLLTKLNGPLDSGGNPDSAINSIHELIQGYGGSALPASQQPSGAYPLLDNLDLTSVIASLQQAGESTADALARVKGEIVGKFTDAIDALERAIQALPDKITDPGLFKLPGLAVAAVSSFKDAIQSITGISGLLDAQSTQFKNAFAQLQGYAGDLSNLVPSMQRVVSFLFKALGLDTLIDLTSLKSTLISELDDAIAAMTTQAEADAKAAFQSIRDNLNTVLGDATDLAHLDIGGLLQQFNKLTTAITQYTSSLSTASLDKIITAENFFSSRFPGRFNFRFDSGVFKAGLEFDFSTDTTVNLDFGLTSGFGQFPLGLQSSGNIDISVGAGLKIGFGIDTTLVTSDPLDSIFLFPDTSLALTAKVNANDLSASATIAGLSADLGYAGHLGTLQLMKSVDSSSPDFNQPASLTLALDKTSGDSNSDGRIQFSEIPGWFDAQLTGELKIDVPVRIAGVALTPDLVITIPDISKVLNLSASDIDIQFPTIDFQNFSLDISNILQILENVLTVVETGLKSNLLAKLPLVGSLQIGSDNVFEKTRNILADIKNALDQITQSFGQTDITKFIQAVLYQTLGPGTLTSSDIDSLSLPSVLGDFLKNTLPHPGLDVIKRSDTGTAFNAHDQPNRFDGLNVIVGIASGLTLVSDPQASVEIDLRFAGSMNWMAAFNLGFNALNLISADATGNVQLGIGYDFEVGMAIGKQYGLRFLLNKTATPEITFNVNVSLPNSSLKLDLLDLLTLTATDHAASPSHASGTATIDLDSTQLTADNVPFISLLDIDISKIQATPSFSADVHLDLDASAAIKGDDHGTLPSIRTEFVLDWGWNLQDGGTINTLDFKNLRLDLGSFISGSLKQVFEDINTFLEPLQPVFDLLHEQVPIVSQLLQLVGSDPLTFLDAIGLWGDGGATVAKTLGILSDINNFLKQVDSLPNSIFISFGDFDLLNGTPLSPNNPLPDIPDTTSNDLGNLNYTPPNPGDPAPSDSDKGKVTGFLTGIRDRLGIDLPLLTHPSSILKLLTGKDADLVVWNIPPLDATFSFDLPPIGPIFPPFPIFAKIGGSFSMFLNLTVGLNTRGIRTHSFLDGFFFGTDKPVAGVSMEVHAGAEFEIPFAKAGVEGGIGAEISASWHDADHDGKLYLDELLTNFQRGLECIFDLSGRLHAFLKAYLDIELDLGFFSVTIINVSVTLVDVTLIDFDHTCPPLPPPEPATQIGDTLYLNIGPRAGDRQAGAQDGDESISIRGEYDVNGDGVLQKTVDVNGDGFISQDELRDDLDNDGVITPGTVAVTGFGQTRIFTGVAHIVGDGGKGKDSIILDPSVTVPAVLHGGIDNDIITGGSGQDTIYGDDGDDQLSGGPGNDEIHGGTGNDLIYGNAGLDTIYGEDGDDTIYGGNNDNKDVGDLGDVVHGGTGNDQIYGGLGGKNTLYGEGGNDVLTGGPSDDYLDGGDDNDQIMAGDGNDTGIGGSGDDSLYGGKGNDVLIGGSTNGASGDGNDLMFGNSGDDLIFGGNANVTNIVRDSSGFITARTITLFGNSDGSDTIVGGSAQPEANEPDGNDEIYGQAGDDLILGGHGAVDPASGDAALLNSGAPGGNDRIFGGDGNDRIYGQGGNDVLYGDDGAVTLDSLGHPITYVSTRSGFGGNDNIFGNDGADIIVGGAGDDNLDGGDGAVTDIVLGDEGTIQLTSAGVVTSVATATATVGGDDTLAGGAGDDILMGGSGADSVTGSEGNDVLLGDNGQVTWNNSGVIQKIASTDPSLGGNDSVVGNDGNDIAFGGFGDDRLTGNTNADILLGDNGEIDFTTGQIAAIFTTDPSNTAGGVDTISGGAGNDIMLGGVAGDTIRGDGSDIILGDEGLLRYDVAPNEVLPGLAKPGIVGDNNLATLDLVISIPTVGGVVLGDADTISGGPGSDIEIGGVGADTLYGDDAGAPSGASDGADILLGDNGVVFLAGGYTGTLVFEGSAVAQILTTDSTESTGGADTISGNAGSDVILGGVNGDTLYGDQATPTAASIANDGGDVILGDNGVVDFHSSNTAQSVPLTLTLVNSLTDGLGGADTVSGNKGGDVVMGGTGGDTIYGDDASFSAGQNDTEDILLGDNGEVDLSGSPGGRLVILSSSVRQIFTTDTLETTGGADTLSGNAGNDVLLGGVNHGGIDVLYGDRAVPTAATIANDGNDVLLGDNGLLDFTGYPDLLTLNLIHSNQDGLGGTDILSGNKGADVAIGGTGNDTLYGDDATAGAAAADGADILLGDNADIYLTRKFSASGGDLRLVLPSGVPTDAAVKSIETTDALYPAYGGSDTLSGNAGGDIIAGGVQGDTLYGDRQSPDATSTGNDGNDILLGDNALLEWLSTGRLSDVQGIDLAANNPALYAKYGSGNADTDLTTLDLVTTEQPTNGGRDVIYGDEGKDVLFGGTDSDILYGDDGSALPEGSGTATNNDLLFGDHGRLYPQFSTVAGINSRNFFAIDTGDNAGGQGDQLWGEEGNDILLGEQGDDRIWGGSGDDDMIGGANVSGAFDEISAPAINAGLSQDPSEFPQINDPAHGINDLMDGGSGNDAMAGDNAIIWRRGDTVSPRFRLLTAATIYTTSNSTITTNVGTLAQSDPSGATGRDIQLVDHANNTAAGLYGNDMMAGGGNNDTMFGELGNDLVQGDGLIQMGGTTDGVSTTRQMSVSDSGLPSRAGTLYFKVPKASTDGDDYLEGNGGNDLLYGGVGQDDIIGGSSELFGLVSPAMRPDGSDVIFGEAGVDTARDSLGDAVFNDSPKADGSYHYIQTTPNGHALDADYIMGDNADVFRLVNAAGRFLQFNYDQSSTFETRTQRIVPRAMRQLDYTLGGADYAGGSYSASGVANADNGLADVIHGEAGDDTIFGMTGSDVLFGDGQDDDLVGGYGNDWLSGGTGQDGVLGDDGIILTSRNGTAEPLFGLAATTQQTISTPGQIQYAVINPTGELKKTFDLTPFSYDHAWTGTDDEFPDNTDQPNTTNIPFADDIIFGGLGGDFLHGGSGDDAISGAEALSHAYGPRFASFWQPNGVVDLGYDAVGLNGGQTQNPGNVLEFNALDRPNANGQTFNNRNRAGEFFLYDEYEPMRKVQLDLAGNLWKPGDTNVPPNGPLEFLLNFDPADPKAVIWPAGTVPKATGQQATSYPQVSDDGKDAIFGDNGNDWLVGGTGRDDLYGGWGNDLINADDNQGTDNNANDQPDTAPTYEDRAYGGAGRDVLIANTGGDRLIDWVGEYNSYIVPFAPFGMATVSRTLQPQLQEFLYALSKADGADPTRPADTGADPLRNGEPAGELGLVIQKDFAWQAQTGAPSDPQAGNLPGGKRDVLRSADFNDGTVQGFAADSGTWTVIGGRYQVAPTVAGGDAVSVFYVDSFIPSYFEMQATINAVKPTGGANANAYLVFDYQGPTDFKFAGINVSTNKLEIGHRTAAGWFVDKQLSFPGTIKSGTDYNLFLALNGSNATLTVNNQVSLSYTFAARVDLYGMAHGLNDGMVGLGARNAQAQIDNVVVQRIAPVVTLNQTVDFNDGTTGGLFSAPTAGTWAVGNGRYAGTPGTSAPAIDLFAMQVAPASLVDLSAKLSTTGAGGFVYDAYDVNDFKFVTVSVATKQIIMGHRTSKGWFADAVYSYASLASGVDYTLGLTLKGTTVSVTLNGQTVLSRVYNALVTDGRFGLLSQSGNTSFDSVTLKTDDPAFATTALVTAVSPALAPAAAVTAA